MSNLRETLISCHYLEEGGQVTSFGHGQCFRIPYQKRIGDDVPKNLQAEKIQFWASRIFFEDAVPKNFKTLQTSTAPPEAIK